MNRNYSGNTIKKDNKIKINEELGLWNSWKVILTGIVRWCLWSEIVNEVKIRYDVKTGVYELTWNEMWAQKEIACEKEDPIGACNNWILDSWEECDGWYNLQNYKTWIFYISGKQVTVKAYKAGSGSTVSYDLPFLKDESIALLKVILSECRKLMPLVLKQMKIYKLFLISII